VRLNPDLDPTVVARSDLEFFIPQLCSFYLGEGVTDEEAQKLLTVIQQASQINFFFAHRIYFFFNSSIHHIDEGPKQQRALEALMMLAEVALVNEEEQLYLANSKTYSNLVLSD